MGAAAARTAHLNGPVRMAGVPLGRADAVLAQALAGITGRPVRERVLYLVRAGMGYQV